MAPVSNLLLKMSSDEAWARQKWERGAGGYRFDVLAVILLKRVEAAGRTTDSGERESKDVYRLGKGAQSLGIEASRLVSGRPAEGGGPEFLENEIEHGVPPCLAGLSAAQTKSTFRAVALHGCVEFDLVASWLICAAEQSSRKKWVSATHLYKAWQ